MRKKPLFWIGPVVLLGFVTVGAGAADAAPKTAKKKSTTAARPQPAAAQKRTLYSAERSLTRRATVARARVNAVAREMAEVLPRYKVDASGEMVPDVRAAAAIVYDPETNEVLWEENSQSQRSIASITKVMTATVFFENNPDTSQTVTIVKSDVFQASTTRLRLNDRVTIDDLLHLLLIASDNAAARALARVSPYGSEGFVVRMNEKAVELGLENTSYADPSGLLWDNVSSAYDMARLITDASGDDRIASIMRMQGYTIYTGNRRVITLEQHQPSPRQRRCRCQGREDRVHLQGRVLPGDAASPAGKRPPGRRGGPRRTVERRTLHGNTEPVHLAVRASPVDLRDENVRSPAE